MPVFRTGLQTREAWEEQAKSSMVLGNGKRERHAKQMKTCRAVQVEQVKLSGTSSGGGLQRLVEE